MDLAPVYTARVQEQGVFLEQVALDLLETMIEDSGRIPRRSWEPRSDPVDIGVERTASELWALVYGGTIGNFRSGPYAGTPDQAASEAADLAVRKWRERFYPETLPPMGWSVR
jgi:hypothetical protein